MLIENHENNKQQCCIMQDFFFFVNTRLPLLVQGFIHAFKKRQQDII